MSRRLRLIGLAFGLAGAHAAMAGDELEALQKKIGEKWNKLNAVAAKFKLDQDMEIAAGMSVKATGEGTYEYLKQGDKPMSRVEIQQKMVQTMSGQEMRMESTTLMVDDGEFIHTLIDQGESGQKMATKAKSDPKRIGGGGEMMIEQAKESYTLKLLPDETVEGRTCWVIEGKPKDGEHPGGVVRNLTYVDQEYGMATKIVGLDAAGKAVTTISYTELKINGQISPDRFVFKAPEGVEVMDMTQ